MHLCLISEKKTVMIKIRVTNIVSLSWNRVIEEIGNVSGNNIKGEKLGKGSIVGIASRRTLADISNFPVSRKTLAEASTCSQLNQDGKSQSVIVGKDYIEKVQRVYV